jgi:hypothetical protein
LVDSLRAATARHRTPAFRNGSAEALDPGATAQATYSFSSTTGRTHRQKIDWYCVLASIQMMLNLVKGNAQQGRGSDHVL